MLTIDGSLGEGGGQVLRTAVSLSLVTGQPFRIENIRAGRPRPGLLRQHLTAVKAAEEIGSGRTEGAEIGSGVLTFVPGPVVPGAFHFAVGSAGSATLVLQTVLPALLTVGDRSVLTLEGGTHNPLAPPFEFIRKAFLPLISRMGPQVAATLERPGFYPAGGGRFRVQIDPCPRLSGFELLERGALRRVAGRAVVANLPRHIAEREVRVLTQGLGLCPGDVVVDEVAGSPGAGNALILEIESEHVTEVITGFGEKGVPAEEVAAQVVRRARRYLEAGVPVAEHLADQLLLPLALAGGGRFVSLAPTLHAETNARVLERFLDVRITWSKQEPERFITEIGPR